jgi:hypothetical protein
MTKSRDEIGLKQPITRPGIRICLTPSGRMLSVDAPLAVSP